MSWSQGRRIEFTSDPRVLSAQLHADFQELVESADLLGQRGGDERLAHDLTSLYHAASNMANRVNMARAALADSHRWNEPPEWEVTDMVARSAQESDQASQ